MTRGRTGPFASLLLLLLLLRLPPLLCPLRFAASTARCVRRYGDPGAVQVETTAVSRMARPDAKKEFCNRGEPSFSPFRVFPRPRVAAAAAAVSLSPTPGRWLLHGGVWGVRRGFRLMRFVTYQEISSRRDARCSVAVASRGGCRRELGGRRERGSG